MQVSAGKTAGKKASVSLRSITGSGNLLVRYDGKWRAWAKVIHDSFGEPTLYEGWVREDTRIHSDQQGFRS